jgi:hypothetical protein
VTASFVAKAASSRPFCGPPAHSASGAREIAGRRGQQARKAASHAASRDRRREKRTPPDGAGKRFREDSVNFPSRYAISAFLLRSLDGKRAALRDIRPFHRRHCLRAPPAVVGTGPGRDTGALGGRAWGCASGSGMVRLAPRQGGAGRSQARVVPAALAAPIARRAAPVALTGPGCGDSSAPPLRIRRAGNRHAPGGQS